MSEGQSVLGVTSAVSFARFLTPFLQKIDILSCLYELTHGISSKGPAQIVNR